MGHYLYRLYNEADELLYIGISKSAIHRLHQHLENQPWSEQISKQTIQRFPSRQALEIAEQERIYKEAPRYNIMHNAERAEQTAERRRKKAEKFLESWREATLWNISELRMHDWAAFGYLDGVCYVGVVRGIETRVLDSQPHWYHVKTFNGPAVSLAEDEILAVSFDERTRKIDGRRGIKDELDYLLYFKKRWEKEYAISKGLAA